MLGFVSALSSAVAVMILLMAVLLVNLLSLTLEQDRKKDYANLIYNSETEQKHRVVMPLKGFSFSVTDLLPFRASKEGVVIRIYCTYGNNLSLDIAQKYTTYNYIIAKKALRDIDQVLVGQPVYEPSGKNNCIAEEVAK